MGVDENGNILYVQTGSSKMLKINYLTGEGISRVDLSAYVSHPTGPSVSSDGTIYVGNVLPKKSIATFDSDLAYVNNAVDITEGGYSRTLEVSADGLSLFDMRFSSLKTFIYTRTDEFSAFALTDSLVDMSIESSAWNPSTGKLWISNDPRGDTSLTAPAWFEYDASTKELTGTSFTWENPADADAYARGLDFSPDGKIAYAGTYATGTPRIQKFMFGVAPTVAITFEADMTVQVDKGLFAVDTGKVTLAGSMNGWDAVATPMLDADGDKVYSVTLDLTEGDALEFKFVKNGSGWESVPNRTYTVPASADTYKAFFDNDDGRELKEIAVSFQVNMELEIAASRFDPANDTLSARGSFNGWSDATKLAPSVTDPNIYEGSAQYESFDGDVIYYKFAYTSAAGTNWETNPPTSSNNYEHTVTSTDISNAYTMVPLRGYNNSTLDNVVNQESVIRFEVDMNNAVDGNGVAFPSIDNVFLAGSNPPLVWPGGGWPDADSNLVIFLHDDGTMGDATAGDNKWSKEVTFPIYSPFDIEYKYGANWGLSSNGGANDNEGGVGSNHHVTLFKSFWYGDAIDVFGTMETKDVVNGVEQVGTDVPAVYELGQNYPNPFNPSTVIDFSIPESGLVTMKIFNILGQEVAELVNDVKAAGSYNVSFDASNLTSGMYIYKIQSGNFSATRKMLLIK